MLPELIFLLESGFNSIIGIVLAQNQIDKYLAIRKIVFTESENFWELTEDVI